MQDFRAPLSVVLDDLDELSITAGTPLELWLGAPNETDDERAARLAAARDILTDEPELLDRVVRVVLRALDADGQEQTNVVPLPVRTGTKQETDSVASAGARS
ncbi:hypothetical protein [Streptomyces phytohabitans]|uniref:hypothetical protein n=1 Tax=Streptomyces phytohabitans TaxID=1150371 RepID=UPI00345B99C1